MVMIGDVIYQVRDSDVILRGIFKSMHSDIEYYSLNSIILTLVNDGILVRDVTSTGILILRIIDKVPCEICGTPTLMTGTKRCNNCWEVEHRIGDYIKNEKGRQFILDLLNRK